MARTALSREDVARSGLAATYTSAIADGHQFANDGRTFIHVKNTSGGTVDVTVQTPGTVHGLAVEELVVTVPATTGDVMIGPFPPGVFNQPSDSPYVYVDYESTSGVTIAVLHLTPEY